MLQVGNNKHKKVIPGNQAILVQQKSSAFKNPDEVAGLVRDYCNRVLQLSNFGVKLRTSGSGLSRYA